MQRLPPAVEVLADQQDGVLAVRQLEGVSRSFRRAQIAAGRWQAPARGVVVLHNSGLTYEQRALTALMMCPPGSALSGMTAVRLDGLNIDWLSLDPGAIFVTVPCGRRKPRAIGAKIHFSNFLADVDVHPTRLPRRTRLPRSIVDAASWMPNERTARAIVLAGVQQRLVTPRQLELALERRGSCLHHALITETIIDARGGIASVPEAEFDQIRRAYGLPEPSRQVVRRRRGGRYYLDVHWDEYVFGAEIEGLHHFESEQRERDLDRYNDLVIGGDHILLITSYSVRRRAEHVGQMLVAGLVGRGWTPENA